MDYINLSAGLLQNKFKGIYCHIQSSHIESKSWDKLFYTLPDDLLYRLAIGEEVNIIDCSSNSKGKVIKSIPIIIHFLKRYWMKELDYRGLQKEYMERIYRTLSKHTKRKIKYFRKFYKNSELRLTGISIKVEKELTK